MGAQTQTSRKFEISKIRKFEISENSENSENSELSDSLCDTIIALSRLMR